MLILKPGKRSFFIFIIFLLLSTEGKVFSQTKTIQGFVYGNIYRDPIDSVQVYSNSGNKTVTDKNGAYLINIQGKNDSIWFRFLNKDTKKFSVDTISNPRDFEVRIYLPDYYKFDHELPTVTVNNKNYHEDSLQLRKDYANIFNRQKPWQAVGNSVGVSSNGGVGVDLDAIINLFRFGYNHRQEVYQKFALNVEQEKYIDHRFNKELIEKLIGLYDKERDEYMKKYRPTYTQLSAMNDTQLAEYIHLTYKKYLKEKQKSDIISNIIISPDSTSTQ
ncbi:hypothetical protein A9P82_11925 [Arachidicoccus ginsenosidimutans]|uniref:hypothetical protein n=1 Tax=Arachidicoccus sp. BS20 TaxID=1850526 RepID=UPI0007F154F5|nr:hypothetical protein [Arachidicoccus sp. BS20]ANI89933.1 hypothetical protein A9P82_11925 [Arachidicoccus sp. BS20]